MKVGIFGASGRTGRRLVERALNAGHGVAAFVRDPARSGIPHGRPQVFRVDVTDAATVEVAVGGRDAVLGTLGRSETSSEDVQTVGTGNIVRAMEKHGVRRIVGLAEPGVRDPEDRPKAVDRVSAFLPARLQPAVLRDARGHVEVRGKSGTGISRADAADFMLDRATDDTYLCRMPVASYLEPAEPGRTKL